MEETMKNLSSSYEMNGSVNASDSYQTINYQGANIDDVTGVQVIADKVSIVPSTGDHNIGSSKVRLKDMVDYSWEYKFYEGQILAIHISGAYIAYGIQGKDTGIIRVINVKTSERTLIKGIEGMTQDVAFAFILNPILLACIDSVGDVFVYKIEENKMKALSGQLTLHIRQCSNDKLNKINRIVWCPFVPDEDEAIEDDDPSKLIVTRGNKAHLWNVNTVQAKHGINPVTPDTVTDGFLEIEIDGYTIVDVAFSPDGSTVALACSDGGVRFFQVDVQEGQSPVCIHDWRPHDNKPVSCLYFLDNHLDPDCHFWKFAITGVEGNTELKLWTCETWTCLQTIKYEPIDDLGASNLKLKVAVDITANFILISDMQRRLLHVLQLRKNKEETEMRVHIISEFLLSSPILSFGVVKAKEDYFSDEALSTFENSVNVIHDSGRTAIDTNENLILRTMIQLYLVQPKALHECIIVYNSEEMSSKFSGSELMAKNLYGDVVEDKIMNGLKEKSAAKMYGADDFTSDNYLVEDCTMTRRLQEFLENKDVTRRSIERETISHHANTVMNGDPDQEDIEEECNPINQNENGVAIVSTGSSPSREVQNILFSSQVSADNIPEIPVKNTETELSSSMWPEIPIPEPDIICQKMSNMKIRNPTESICVMEESKTSKYADYSTKMESTLSSMFTKMEILEKRFNNLNESVKEDLHDVKQTLKVMNQYLMANKDEDKKKQQRTSNLDDRFTQDRLATAISQNVNSMIGSEVEYLIKQEINSSVLPSLKNTMDTFGQQLQLKMQHHLSTADQQLKEHIIKTVHKKSVTDALANTLASVLPTVISSSFAEVFCNVILPKFEKSCHEMFDQVNNLFVDGTKDFVNVLQNHVRSYEEKQCSILQHKMDEFMVRLNEVTENISFNAMKGLEPQLLNTLQKSLDEQKKYLETYIMHASRAPTPSIIHSATKTQEQVEYLITQGKIEDAIEQVLSASDLKLLIRLCDKLDPDKLFAEPCIIQQHILLSFIQQLSVDFNIQTDLKHRFIEGAVLSLDRRHPICEKNIPRILPAVRSRIAQYIVSNPNNKNTRNMKMLLMAVDSLLADKNDI